MSLSGLIFVALFFAWAAYLIPKAVRHHDEVARSRSVDRFSSTMRVLARREPVSGRDARLVVTPARGASGTVVETKGKRLTAAQVRARREAARKAAQRRRRVLIAVLLLNAVVGGLAGVGLIGWLWEIGPAVLLVSWLAACRVMVVQEQTKVVRRRSVTTFAEMVEGEERAAVPETIATERDADGFETVSPAAETSTLPAIKAPLWNPVDVPLPTYVSKPAAERRTVRTIDLGTPGAWTSGNTAADSALAREADAAATAARTVAPEQRATGT